MLNAARTAPEQPGARRGVAARGPIHFMPRPPVKDETGVNQPTL
jgi:hypothetical protein